VVPREYCHTAEVPAVRVCAEYAVARDCPEAAVRVTIVVRVVTVPRTRYCPSKAGDGVVTVQVVGAAPVHINTPWPGATVVVAAPEPEIRASAAPLRTVLMHSAPTDGPPGP